MNLAWSRQMSVGNESIDSEHKALLNLVDDIKRAIRGRDAEALSQAFKLFETSVRTHFSNEERIADAINYPFDEHKLEHRYVLDEPQTMREELLPRNGRWSESAVKYYYSFLSEWSTAHIREDDMQMKATLETYPYDFKPPASAK